jgi:hypothetical protein
MAPRGWVFLNVHPASTTEATQQHLSQNFAQRTHQDFTDFSYFRLTCVTETELKFYSIPAPDDMEPK